MTRREYILDLLKTRPRTAGAIAVFAGGTVAQAETDLHFLQDDPDLKIPVLVCEGGVWRLDPTKTKAPPPLEPKTPVRRRTT